MDWVEEFIEKIKVKKKNTSIKKTLIIYIVIAIFFIGMMYFITLAICDNWNWLLAQKYYPESGYSPDSKYSVQLTGYEEFTIQDNILFHILRFMESYSILIYTGLGIVYTSFRFYNDKLKVPISLLKEEAHYISKNDLTFECSYDSQDEMGDLCLAFDSMRTSLIQNNQMMWDMMEEQKRLNAAFAHDLRTPLTVLHGYTDLLTNYYPKGLISDEKLMDTLKCMENNITRIEKFANTMKDMNSIHDIKVTRHKMNSLDLMKSILETVTILDGKNGIGISCHNNIIETKIINIDKKVFLEVFDNLISNALRFAKSKINIYIELSEENKLILYVKDDGKGFLPEEIPKLTKPYYSSNKKESGEHFGIGLTICQILCEKHGGDIGFVNGLDGGGIVSASFFVL